MSLKILIRTGSVAATALIAALAITSTASAQSTIRVGQTINGTLSASDAVMEVDGSNYDCYIVSTRAGQSYTIDLDSDDFDTFIGMGAGRGCQPPVDDYNDDRDDGSTNSRLTFTSSGGDYFILANSYAAGATGAYRLTVSEGGSSNAASADVQTLTRPSEPEARYDFDSTCAAFGTLGMLDLMQEEMSDAELERLLLENYTLLTNVEQSGAAIGKSAEVVSDEVAELAVGIITDPEVLAQLPTIATRQACVDASRR